ncbi:hypothetical protein J8L85_12615 [Maribacter sp. MMG018]|uniref:hypothetical protein n=1 Tax=Maribacter sp. MMG018 TaxID=2822688 RepID=UPI001B365B07|nr:hypothetical protein [Maribacter sp. MMG018]MBQ4915287.1 hypothetical protein [Maribacter sp. MMG018]
MKIVNHQLLSKDFFIPKWEIKHLFLGTFNPEGGEEVNYFYGRNRNQTWKLLSEIFKDEFNPKEFDQFLTKLKKHKIACMDMIKSVKVINEDISLITGKGYSDSKIINNTIEREHNTTNIIEVIKKNPGVRLYSTWGKGPIIKNWNVEIDKIGPIISLTSPSMAAKVPKGEKKYDYMLEDWLHKIKK